MSIPLPDHPLVTLCLLAYKQERFIREAVRSALAQTYEPLEIILTDDCSPDGTFELMRQEAEAYRGPHAVVINRNDTNLGLATSLNKAAELATGSLLVIQAGDDISLPDRTTKLVRAAQEPTPVDMVCSNVAMIDEAGNLLDKQWQNPIVTPLTVADAVAKGSISALGCACAYSRVLWSKYGPIDPRVLQEDGVLPFRALLGRGIRVVDEHLVKYRVHGNNLFIGTRTSGAGFQSREVKRRWALNWLGIAQDWSNAWAVSGGEDLVITQKLKSISRQRQYDVDCYGRSRSAAALITLRGFCDGLTLRNAAGLIKRHVIRCG